MVRGQFVGINVSTGTDNISSSISFVEPAFLGRDLAFKFNAYYTQTDNQNADYSTRLIGISPAIEFPVSENGRLELRYTVQETTLKDVMRVTQVDDPTTPEDETLTASSPILWAEEDQRRVCCPVASATPTPTTPAPMA